MDINKFFQSKVFKWCLFGLAGLIVLLLIFKVGLMVGFRKAGFSYGWGENYHRNFAGPRNGFLNNFNDGQMMGAHGAFGQIIKIDGGTVVMKGPDSIEKIVLINEDTSIRRFQENIKVTDLNLNDYIVVIGEPNNSGQIEAKFIRLMPAPMMGPGAFRPTPPRLP